MKRDMRKTKQLRHIFDADYLLLFPHHDRYPYTICTPCRKLDTQPVLKSVYPSGRLCGWHEVKLAEDLEFDPFIDQKGMA